MHELYELKEKLCNELKEYGTKDLSAGTLDVVDKLAHTVKNIDKIIEEYEEGGYSGMDHSYGDGMNSHRGRSYARRRDSMGRYSRNYSRDEAMVSELRDLMQDAPDDRTRQEFQRFISKIESMA